MDYAVFKTGGKQYRVQPGDTLDVEMLLTKSIRWRSLVMCWLFPGRRVDRGISHSPWGVGAGRKCSLITRTGRLLYTSTRPRPGIAARGDTGRLTPRLIIQDILTS